MAGASAGLSHRRNSAAESSSSRQGSTARTHGIVCTRKAPIDRIRDRVMTAFDDLKARFTLAGAASRFVDSYGVEICISDQIGVSRTQNVEAVSSADAESKSSNTSVAVWAYLTTALGRVRATKRKQRQATTTEHSHRSETVGLDENALHERVCALRRQLRGAVPDSDRIPFDCIVMPGLERRCFWELVGGEDGAALKQATKAAARDSVIALRGDVSRLAHNNHVVFLLLGAVGAGKSSFYNRVRRDGDEAVGVGVGRCSPWWSCVRLPIFFVCSGFEQCHVA